MLVKYFKGKYFKPSIYTIPVKFCNILICANLLHIYYATKAVQLCKVLTVGNIVVSGGLTHCALFYSVYDFKPHR